MSTSTLNGTVTTTLPRVNLLPPEIMLEARFRKAQMFMGAALLLAVGLVLGLSQMAADDASAAADEYSSVQAQGAVLQAKVNTFSDVPRVYAQVAAAKAQVNLALSTEVRYSYLLNDLSLTIPSNVYLIQLDVSQPDSAAAAGNGSWGNPVIAKISFKGKAKTLPDVAAWLDSLIPPSLKQIYTDPWVSSSVRTDPKGWFLFQSDIGVTQNAYSHHYQKLGS
jgi:Tfp pilus assembly protein PilN